MPHFFAFALGVAAGVYMNKQYDLDKACKKAKEEWRKFEKDVRKEKPTKMSSKQSSKKNEPEEEDEEIE